MKKRTKSSHNIPYLPHCCVRTFLWNLSEMLNMLLMSYNSWSSDQMIINHRMLCQIQLNILLYTHMYLYVRMCQYKHTLIHVYTYVCMYCIYVLVRICTYACTYVLHIRMYIYLNIRMYLYICMYLHICIYLYTNYN